MTVTEEPNASVSEDPESKMLEPIDDHLVEAIEKAEEERSRSLVPVSAMPNVNEWAAMLEIAEVICNTPFVPADYRGQPEAVVAAILYGRELGMGMMSSLRDVHMIDGHPSLSAHRQLGLMRRNGVKVLESESTPVHARIKAERTDTGERMDITYTIEDAREAKLLTKKNWEKFPADMLWARCVGRLSRRLASDLLGGLPPYVAEEARDFEDDWRDRPPPPTNRRERRRDTQWNRPKDWREISDRLAIHLGPEGAAEWVAEAINLVYEKPRVADLDAEEAKEAGIALCDVIYALEQAGDLTFDTDPREKIRAIFAKAFGGVALDGPPWRLGPKELDRDLLTVEGDPEEEFAKAVETEEAEHPEGYEEDPTIPFGE